MKIPFHKPYLTEDEISLVTEVIKSGWITMGPKTIQFEQEFKDYIFTNSNIPKEEQFAISFNSGTAALHLALKAIGLKQGDEVIIPTNTFVATAEVVTYFSAIPVFCDIEYDTCNMDVAKLTSLLTRKTKAIIPVHFAGQPCDMDEILDIGRKHGISIIEDAAHCLPSSYKGRRIGTIGDITCFSFYATKTLAAGEGGMAVTNNPDYANCMKINRLHGISCDAWDRYTDKGKWYYEVVDSGFKYNTTDIHSAIAIVQLKKLEWMGNKRAKIAQFYNNAFKSSRVITPVIKPDRTTSWHLYVIKVKNRDELIDKLKESGIGTSVHFIPVHMHPYYKTTYGHLYKDYPQAKRVFNESVSIPIYPSMTEAEIEYVAEKLLEYAR